MRSLLAGACSLLVLLAGCGSAVADRPGVPAAPSGGGAAAAAGTTHCPNPEGFAVRHPADWYANPGEVLPACSWFASAPFTVPRDSDVRTADITMSVQPGDGQFAPRPDETARRTVEVGGRTAVRIEQVTGPGFYPEGTPITTYVVDLGPAHAGEVLVAEAVGLPGSDHDRDVEVLDAMMASLTLDGAGRL